MTAQHYSFPSIEQYRTVIKYVNDRAARRQVPRPKLAFHGTVKLHGTNASIVANSDGEYWAQSRSTVITPEADNAGFAAFAHRSDIKAVLTAVALNAENAFFASHDWVERYPVDVAVYGEWCGGNIQSGVALNKLGKMFVIFAIRLLSKDDDERKSIWLMPWDVEKAFESVAQEVNGRWITFGHVDNIASFELPVYCIEKFKTWHLEVDFVDPAATQNELVRITTEVEAECPVGAAFGVSGVGEGVVWTCVGDASRPSTGEPTVIQIDDLVFKVKGEKHSDTKVKTVGAVDIERLNSIKELAESFITDHRLEKGLAFLQETGVADVYDVKNIGPFLKWVGTDIIKEETDTIVGNGFEVKDVTKAINNLAKEWFLQRSRQQD